MEYYFSPHCSTFLYQDEGMEELRHYVLYVSELEATIDAAKEEITRREVEIVNLKDILNKTMKERNEALEESKKLFLENIILQQQLEEQDQEKETEQEMHQLHLKQETPPPPLPVVVVPGEDDKSERKLEIVVKIAAEKPLPEKGKLLQAVKEAGPLLQTLLLAGPLPQWQHPPPQLPSIDIPPVSISSFNTFPSPLTPKRMMIDSPSPPPINKFHKVSFL